MASPVNVPPSIQGVMVELSMLRPEFLAVMLKVYTFEGSKVIESPLGKV
jgi:hypothetical protein